MKIVNLQTDLEYNNSFKLLSTKKIMPKNQLYWPNEKYETVKEAVNAIAKRDYRLNQIINLPKRKISTFRLNKLKAKLKFKTYADFLEYCAFNTWSSRCDDGQNLNIEDILKNELGVGEKTIDLLLHHLRGKELLSYFEPPREQRIPVNFRF